jgi:hypothetical protein
MSPDDDDYYGGLMVVGFFVFLCGLAILELFVK